MLENIIVILREASHTFHLGPKTQELFNFVSSLLTSSKTFLSPFCVRAEHSTYFTALSSFAKRSPISKLNGFCLFFAGKGENLFRDISRINVQSWKKEAVPSFSIVAASSLRSIWVPTRRKGVFWQWWVISGTHLRIRTCDWSDRVRLKHEKSGKLTFPSHSQRKMEKLWRSRQGRHPSEKFVFEQVFGVKIMYMVRDGSLGAARPYLRIWKWAKSVVVFLAGCVKKTKSVRLSSDHHCHGIVVKHLQLVILVKHLESFWTHLGFHSFWILQISCFKVNCVSVGQLCQMATATIIMMLASVCFKLCHRSIEQHVNSALLTWAPI